MISHVAILLQLEDNKVGLVDKKLVGLTVGYINLKGKEANSLYLSD